MKIALDLASYNVVDARLADFKEIVEKYTDIVFANEEEARSFTGREPGEALNIISQFCEVAVIKVGGGGSWVKRGEEIIKIDAAKVNLKDTTGAGDLYASGFLYGYAQNESLDVCGQYGSVLAGHVIEIVGARMDPEKWENIKSIVSEISKSGYTT
jgi:sugar/nucleoside kinase (ribokinase family)